MVNTEIRLILFFAAKDGEALYKSAKTRAGADCASDHELLIAKFRLKLKKVGKITRRFRYELNQILGDNTVGVKNRFKELHLIDRVGKEMATHSSVLAWRIPGTGEPAGLPSMGSHRVGHD